jgi:hypothetical protein
MEVSGTCHSCRVIIGVSSNPCATLRVCVPFYSLRAHDNFATMIHPQAIDYRQTPARTGMQSIQSISKKVSVYRDVSSSFVRFSHFIHAVFEGPEHCSPKSVAFHYVKGPAMYRLHALLYKKCPTETA